MKNSSFWLNNHFCKWSWTSLPMNFMKNTLSTVTELIAINDRKPTIAIGDLFWNGDRDRDLKFGQDRDRDCDRNFRDLGHAFW